MTLQKTVFAIKTGTVRKAAGRLHSELLRNERLEPERLFELENRRFADIAAFAMRATGYYRDRYRESGLSEGDLRSPDVFSDLPIIDRSDMKEHVDLFWSTEANPRITRDARTGGSTGQPLRLGQDARVPLSALSWRMYSWWGVSPWENIARVGRWHSGRKALMLDALQWWPTRHRYLEAGLITQESMKTFVDQIIATRPVLIEGYVGALLELADFVESERAGFPAPRAVASTAAPLTEPVRKRLETVFGAPVFDEYRSSEVQWMAGECASQDGLHIFSDMRRIEVVGPDGRPLPAGEVGDLVVTDLTNRVFPVIRYRLGDRGAMVPGACSCGITLPRMSAPQGRLTDLIRLPDGSVAAHRLMAMFSEDPDAVHQFQIYQTADYAVHLRVIVNQSHPGASGAIERAADTLRRRLGGRIPVVVEPVSALPRTSGKLQIVYSEVTQSEGLREQRE